MSPPETYKSEIGSQSKMCQVHTGACRTSHYSRLEKPTIYTDCHTRKAYNESGPLNNARFQRWHAMITWQRFQSCELPWYYLCLLLIIPMILLYFTVCRLLLLSQMKERERTFTTKKHKNRLRSSLMQLLIGVWPVDGVCHAPHCYPSGSVKNTHARAHPFVGRACGNAQNTVFVVDFN